MTDQVPDIERVVRSTTDEFERALRTALENYRDRGTLPEIVAGFVSGIVSFRVAVDGLEVMVAEEPPPAQTDN